MQNDTTLSLAALCLGIAITGLFVVASGHAQGRERLSLGLVYGVFIALIASPLVTAFASGLYLFYVPLVLVMLLVLPPAVYHYVAAKTAQQRPAPIHWRDLVFPLSGCAVCIGFWFLPAHAKATMFIAGHLPSGFAPAALALATFVLILCWLVVSLWYLIAILRRLRSYRAHIRQLYSNVDARDLRWVDWLMVFLVVLWAACAASLATENLGDRQLFPAEVLYGLTAFFLLFLTVFASIAPPKPEPETPDEPHGGKYARSALSPDHAAKLAKRIEDAMRKDTLYLDPNLSLQKLSRHVGAVPNLVSQTLNEEIGSSFFDYVARWRIDASKPLILTSDASVLTIALDVGFNSRSTFYKAFKRETGSTPKAYRATQQHSELQN